MSENASELADLIENTAVLLDQARAGIARRIIGQETVVELSLVSLLCGGHALLVGAPGQT